MSAHSMGSTNGSDHGQNQEKEDSSYEKVSRGFQWVKKHPVLATVMWMFGGSENASEYYNELVEQAKAQTSMGGEEGDGGDDIQSEAGLGELNNDFAKLRVLRRAERAHRSKSLSWSDQHGKSLAQYYSVEDHKQPAAASAPQLMYCRTSNHNFNPKSVLKRPSSFNSTVHAGEVVEAGRNAKQKQDQTNNRTIDAKLASILQKNERLKALKQSGILDNPSLDAISSPQWGWYVNITPPKEEFIADIRREVEESTRS